MSKILKIPTIYRKVQWLRLIWSNGLSPLEKSKRKHVFGPKMAFGPLTIRKNHVLAIWNAVCLWRIDLFLGIKIEIPRSRESRRKLLQKGNDRFLPLKDRSLKGYSLWDSSFYKDRPIINEGSILVALVWNFCLICTQRSILEYQRIDPYSWIYDLLSSSNYFSSCNPIWFLLKSFFIPESIVILFGCFHYPPDFSFVLIRFYWLRVWTKLGIYNCPSLRLYEDHEYGKD